MRVYHRTWASSATAILTGGFTDGKEGFVWLSDQPLESDTMKGGDGGDVLLMLDVPDEVIAKHRPKQRATHTAYQVPARDLTNYKIELARTDYAGTTRDMLVGLIKDREAKEAEGREPPKPGSKWSTSQSYRDALAFLDRFAPLP